MSKNRLGKLILISAPSGGGKDTVAKKILEIFPGFLKFTTTTTRKIRSGEKDGKSYHFVSKNEFEKKIKEGKMLEYNIYDGNYYGVEKERLEKEMKNANNILLVVDVNGKKNIDRQGIKNTSIFLMPESMEKLRGRIIKRGGVADLSVEERLKTAQKEVLEAYKYDLVVINMQGRLEETIEKIIAFFKEKNMV